MKSVHRKVILVLVTNSYNTYGVVILKMDYIVSTCYLTAKSLHQINMATKLYGVKRLRLQNLPVLRLVITNTLSLNFKQPN